MRQMNELFNKHERVWFSLLREKSQRQFLQAIIVTPTNAFVPQILLLAPCSNL